MATTTNYALSKPAKGGKNWHLDLNANADTIDTELKKHQTEEEAFKTEANLVAGGHQATGAYGSGLGAESAGLISKEVQDARGSQATLDARLDVGINEDGTLKSDSFTFDQWEGAGIIGMAYVSPTEFSVTGDLRAVFQPGLPVKIDYATSGDRFYHVKDSSLSGGITTVEVWEDDPAVLNETMTQVYTSAYKPNWPVGTGATFLPGSLPANALEKMMEAGVTAILYYDASTYTTPFGGNPATSNSGNLARIEFASGLKIGITYAALGGNVSTIEYKIPIAGVDTLLRTDTPAYDGTTNNITAIARS